jgi:hypothetical protein
VLFLIRIQEFVELIENVVAIFVVLDEVSVEFSGCLLLHCVVLGLELLEYAIELNIFIVASRHLI